MQRKVYLLHGWSTAENTPEKWQKFQTALENHGVESELLRIPGLSAPLNEVWELSDYVLWLQKELDNRGSQDSVLLGHSFGGQIATQFAASYPNRVSQLILIDAAGIRDHSPLATLKRGVFRIAAKVGKVFFRWDWARNLLYLFARERDYKNAPPLLRRTMSNILDTELHQVYRHITASTLLIWGAKDTVTPPWMGKYMQSHIAQADYHEVAEARHSPQYTHVAETVDIISDFLNSQTEGSSS